MGKQLNTVHVKFADSSHNYSTNVNPDASEDSLREYFVGKEFNIGINMNDDFAICKDIEFIDNNK